MHTDSSVPVRDQNGRRNSFTEVSNVERRLWARIHSKGVLDTEVQRLYRNACSVHEKLFLRDNELLELQELEYSLWKLHYKHIDEFRKSISRSLDDKKNTIDKHVEGFKLFLSEATKFYQDLISKIKTFYGLHDKPFFYKNTSLTGGVEQIKFHKCQFVCHRLSICLGDLARYLELYGKPESQRKNWAVAATHYLEAAKMFPESGNPQNQLAVLATYVGDEFLALYHSVRSLAAEEPFPDALRNLISLFEGLYEKGQINFLHSVALWEDYETRGFEPLSQNHLSLDFSTRWEDEINYKMKNDYRAYRIIQAAMKIVNRASDIKHKWILLYDEVSKKFCIKEAKESTDKKGKIVGVEEEEDIVFKPITRRNSEPLRTEDQVLVSDECLRRASSLLTAQNRPRVGSSPLGQHEPKGSVTVSGTLSEAPMSAGPPSLSSWVLNGERLVGESEKGGKFCKNVLDPIEDMDSDRFSALSLSSPRLSPPPHCAPMPSAPLLPDSAILFTGVSAGFSGLRAVENFAAPSMAGCYSNGLSIQGHHSTEPPIPSFIDHSQPFLGLMNPPRSRPLKGNQNLMWANNNAIFAPRNHNNLYGQEPSRSGPAPVPTRNLEWVPPLVYPSSLRLHAAYDQTGALLRDYQRANPYVCGTVTGVRAEQRPR